MEAYIRSSSEGAAMIPITGVVDRLDELDKSEGDGLVIVDYKTGRAPQPRYRESIFFQLEMYALLLRETGRRRERTTLKLIYLGGGGEIVQKDVDDADLEATAARLRSIYDEMLTCFRDNNFPKRRGNKSAPPPPPPPVAEPEQRAAAADP